MPPALRRLLEQLKRKLPPPAILMVPGECFFTRGLELPEGMAAADVPGFAELSIESLAPFPLDQLAWGYLCHEDSRRIFLYATSQAALRKTGIEKMEAHFHVFPSFIALFGKSFEKPAIAFLATARTLTALYFNAHDPVPLKSFSLPLPQPEDGEDSSGADRLAQTQRDLLARLPTEGFTPENTVWVAGAILEHNGRLRAGLHLPDQPGRIEAHALPLSHDAVWAADLRSGDFAVKEQRQRQLSSRLWRSLQVASLAFVVLLALQLLSLGWGFWNKFRQNRIEAQTQTVQRIENDFSLLNRMEEFSQRELKPFSMLDLLNQHRPAAVYFTSVQSESWNRLKIEGLASNLEEVNQYANRMRAAPGIESLNIEKTQTKQGKAGFKLAATFQVLADLPPFPPEELAPKEETAAAPGTPPGPSPARKNPSPPPQAGPPPSKPPLPNRR